MIPNRDDLAVSTVVLASAVIFAIASVGLGQSVNWDFLNYHLYNPHALLTGRSGDLLAAQLQSFHNPLLHVPYYLAYVALPAWSIAVLLGILQGLLAWPLVLLTRRLLPEASRLLTIAVVACGLCGPMLLSELGTAFGDNWVALAVLSALALVVLNPKSARILFVAGVLCGGALGLKLTVMPFALGLACAVGVLRGRSMLPGLLWLALGGLTGFVATYGWWGWHLWATYSNPFFPYFNEWFQSPWGAAHSYRDGRWLADGVLDVALRPLTATFDPSSSLELKFRDVRLPLLCVSAGIGLFWFWRRLWSATLGAVCAFFFTSLGLWAWWFGYYRYLAPLEALMPLLLVVIWYRILPATKRLSRVIIVLGITQLAVRAPDWGRMPLGEPLYPIVEFASDEMILTAGTLPSGFAALYLNPKQPIVRVSSNFHSPGDQSSWSALVNSRIETHTGTIAAIIADVEQDLATDRLHAVGISVVNERCARVLRRALSGVSTNFLKCPVTKLP